METAKAFHWHWPSTEQAQLQGPASIVTVVTSCNTRPIGCWGLWPIYGDWLRANASHPSHLAIGVTSPVVASTRSFAGRPSAFSASISQAPSSHSSSVITG